MKVKILAGKSASGKRVVAGNCGQMAGVVDGKDANIAAISDLKAIDTAV